MAREKALIYIRVSTKMQVDGASLDVQEKACREYAKYVLGADVIESPYREEGESAKTAKRGKLMEMLNYVQTHKGEIDYVVFYDMTRASRDSDSYFGVIKAVLQKNGVKVRSVKEPGIDESPMGRFIETITVGYAQLENDMKKVKVHETMAERASQGYWVTQPPIGFKIKVVMGDGSLVDSEGRKNRVKYPKILAPDTTIPHGETLSISEKLTKIFTRFAKGDISEMEAYGIAVEMNIRGKNGKIITFGRFDDILRSPVYCGYIESEKLLGKGKIVKAQFDGLVSKDIFDRVQAILNGDKRDLKPKNKELYPLDGMILCEQCGRPIHGDAPTDGSGKNIARYYCRGGKKCGHGYKSAKTDVIHDVFEDFLQDICPTDGTKRLFKEILKRTAAKKLDNVNDELKKNRAAETKLDDERTSTLRKFVNNSIEEGDKNALISKIDEERLELRSERVELERQQALNETTIEYVCNFMDKPAKLWRDADLESKQALQKLMFPSGLHIDLKAKKCRPADLSPLFSVIANKKAPEGGNSDTMVISAGVEPALSG